MKKDVVVDSPIITFKKEVKIIVSKIRIKGHEKEFKQYSLKIPSNIASKMDINKGDKVELEIVYDNNKPKLNMRLIQKNG